MSDYKLGEIEMRFADIIWNNEPLTSGELVKLAEKELTWSKSTTYTILRRLGQRGIFKNENGKVTSQISKKDFIAAQSTKFIDETFSGSLPSFLAAFATRKQISETDLAEIQKFIDTHKGV